MIAERTKRAREAQKKAAEEAALNKTPAAEPVTGEPVPHAQPAEKSYYSSLTTTQWHAVGSLVVSLIGLYYKREEIKNLLNKKKSISARAGRAATGAAGGKRFEKYGLNFSTCNI